MPVKKGLKHIGEARGEKVVAGVLQAVIGGKPGRFSESKKTVALELDGYSAILSLDEHGKSKSWLLTGWQEGKPDAVGEVGTHAGATQSRPTFSRAELGADFRRNLDEAARKVKEDHPFVKLLQEIVNGKPVTVYHGSRESGIAELRRYSHVTLSRNLAERFAGREGVVYEAKMAIPQDGFARLPYQVMLEGIASGEIDVDKVAKEFSNRTSDFKNSEPLEVSAVSPDSPRLSFATGPAELAGFMAGDALRRIKDPLRRVQAMSRIARNFQELKLVNERLELLAGGKRVGKSLLKEAAMREAMRHEELLAEVWGRHLGILSEDYLSVP